MIPHTVEYHLIASHYGTRVAQRSGVPLIRHIDQGLTVLHAIGSTDAAMRAFCLHPLLQNDQDLVQNYVDVVNAANARPVLLAMEYRRVANAYLLDRVHSDHDIELSPLGEVNDMLTADKVQNYRDFQAYHSNTHPRREALDLYFRRWLAAVGIDDDTYQRLCCVIELEAQCESE
jgi:hypothetical protein